MAKRRQFSEDATKRIGRVVRLVEHEYQNERPPDGKTRVPQTTWLNLAQLGGTITKQSTGTNATIYTGTPPAMTVGTETVQVYGSLLASTSASVATGKTIVIGFIAGYWQCIAEGCT